MSKIDWDEAAKQKSVLEPGGDQRPYTAGTYGPVPMETTTPFPEALGLLGGIGGAYLSKSPAGARIGQTAGQAFARTLFPSLAGSTAGTAVGLGAESLFQPVSGSRAAGALIENAAWDVGGNLVFALGGKTIRLGKDALDALNITRAGTFDDAKVAAQQYLSQRGGTLTRGQLTGRPLDAFMENIAASGTGAPVFAQQQQGVRTAISKGVEELKGTLQTSPTFTAALKADEPLSRAAGENFQSLINTARTDFKDKYRPFYESLSKDFGVFVDMRPVKAAAQSELDRIARLKDIPANADRKAVLEQIIKQDNAIEFGAAHDLISSFKGAAQDAVVPGAGTTSKGQAYTKFAKQVEDQMDSVIDLSKSKLGDDLVAKYKQVQTNYKEGMQGLYNETITEAMKLSPSKTGAYIFDLAETEKSTDLFKAITQVDKYAAKAGPDASKQVLGDFKYGFLNQAFSSPEKVQAFASKITKGSENYDDELNKAFFKLFKNEANDIKDILNAANIGLDPAGTGAGNYLRNKGVLAGTAALGGGFGYIVAPEEVTTKLPDILATAGVFLITPRLLAKAATNKEAVSALADLSRASNNPKFGGAAAAKLIDRLNASGIIDSEYLNEVNTFLKSPDARQTGETTPATAPVENRINWDTAVGEE
jgi:hypothetical protein